MRRKGTQEYLGSCLISNKKTDVKNDDEVRDERWNDKLRGSKEETGRKE